MLRRCWTGHVLAMAFSPCLSRKRPTCVVRVTMWGIEKARKTRAIRCVFTNAACLRWTFPPQGERKGSSRATPQGPSRAFRASLAIDLSPSGRGKNLSQANATCRFCYLEFTVLTHGEGKGHREWAPEGHERTFSGLSGGLLVASQVTS